MEREKRGDSHNDPQNWGTARSRVRTALSHCRPERVPFSWQFCATPEMKTLLDSFFSERGISWEKLRYETEDICSISPDFCGPDKFAGGPWDIWGIEWQDASYEDGKYREVKAYPLSDLDTPDALDSYSWPDPDWFDYSSLEKKLAEADPGKALKFVAFNPFETLCWMTGLEKVLCNCVMRPEVVTRGLEHICRFYEERLERSLAIIGERVDIIFFFDDLGSQNGPLISPAMYRDLIKPFHKKLFSRAHELAPNAWVMMHSDGSVYALLDDLIDAGLDILEAVQIECADMEPRQLKKRFGDRLSFHGAISVQQLLPHAGETEVESRCRELVQTLGKDGGYIAAPSHAIQIGTPPENVIAMLRGILGKSGLEEAVLKSKKGAIE